MLKPSYAELMEVLNKDAKEASEITSRYTIVIAAAKRARQIIAGDEPMVEAKQGKPLSTAVEEINEAKIKIVPEGEGTVIKVKKPFNEEEYFATNNIFSNSKKNVFDDEKKLEEDDFSDLEEGDLDDEDEISDEDDDMLDSDDISKTDYSEDDDFDDEIFDMQDDEE